MTVWIVNSSPLILLGKIGRLHLLETLAPALAIPGAVASEILVGPDGDPARTWIQCLPDPAWEKRAMPIPPEILAWDLGAGETAVLALALAQAGSICILDDLAARHCAEVFRIPVMGTLGLLLKAKQAGIIPRLQPEMDRLVSAGSLLSPAVMHRALVLAGESS